MRYTIPSSLRLHSQRFQYTVLSVLLAAAALAAVLSLIRTTSHSPAPTARTQTSSLPASHATRSQANTLPASRASRSLLNKPELVALRSAYARHYDLGNGRRLAVVGAAPLNYEDSQGKWQPIQPEFARAENGWSVRDNTLRSHFASDSTAVQLQSNGVMIGWRPAALEIDDDAGHAQQLAVPAPGEAVQAEAAGRTLRYAGAWSDGTLIEQFHSSAGSLKQELVLAQAPAVPADGEWLSLRVALVLPNDVQIIANGQAQTGEFTTYGAVRFQQADGTPLLALLSPQAYEQDNRSAFVGGRYRVVPGSTGVTLWVQTPLAWWLAAERQYPAVLDPTMQVLQMVQSATIRYPYDEMEPNADVLQRACVGACVGICDQSTWWLSSGVELYDRGYVRFKLPSLPDGAAPTKATLVGVPEKTRLVGGLGPNVDDEDTLVHRVTQDWSWTQWWSSVPTATVIAHQLPATDQKEIPWVYYKDFDPDNRPATTWDVTTDVLAWYGDPNTNFGFALVSEDDGQHDDLGNWNKLYFHHCFPGTSGWSNLDDVVDNPSNPTTDGAGLGLLIEYTSPQLAANELRLAKVPSTQPSGTYRRQHHEYDPPDPTRWQLLGARGQRTDDVAKTPLQLTGLLHFFDQVQEIEYITSQAGQAAPGNELYDFKPAFIVANGYQELPDDPRLRVHADYSATTTFHDDRKYHLQIADGQSSPVMPPIGVSTTVPMALGSGFIVGQEFNLPVSTTVEIRIPYNGLPPHYFNVQLFAPSLTYGSRQVNGMQLTPGPDAWTIEVVIPPSQDGTWLLAAINDNMFPTPITLNALMVACQNSLDVVRYPVDGECIELQRPPTTISPTQLYTTTNVRIFSPAGFTADCDVGSCMTKAKKDDGTGVAAMISYAGDDDRWVALKGGQFGIDGSTITTTADVRLVMADFGQGVLPVTLPVLRGQFSVNATSGLMTRTSNPSDTYLLVKAPLPEQDVASGWDYEVNLQQARMRAFGPVSRIIEPTEGDGPTTFDFDAEWSLTARGGLDLQGAATLSNSPGDFRVGTLIVTPPLGPNYTMEHDPTEAHADLPQIIPEFKHIRMTDATLSQPSELGGAQVPVQAVILPPGVPVLVGTVQPPLYCGQSDTCFDLRGEDDAMTATGPSIVRDYRMPDLIIQDQAGTVMINTPQGVEIYSRDHPMSRLGPSADDYSFSYETFGGSVRTYQGECPLPRNPLNPTEVLSGTAQITTILEGTASMSLPNAESEEGGPQISVGFRLCEDSLRNMWFKFDTGDQTAIPLGNSGFFMNMVGGTISLTPGQGSQSGHTTVVLEVALRGMSAQAASSTVFIKGVVTIDSRGLFDMQLQAGVRVFAGIGVGADGHFWVAWAPLDLGFEVQACVPYDGSFDPDDWGGSLCAGNELLFGSLRAHLWQGQGWQNQYSWLPDNDDLHIAARYEVSINIAAGMLVDWAFIVIPPDDIQLFAIKLAFGEFCINTACTQYEWGVMGAYTLLGYDFGMYYGFDSGLDFIIGSADYLLIDEAGQVFSSAGLAPARLGPQDSATYSVTIPAGAPSAMFILGWNADAGIAMTLTLREPPPGNRTIDVNTVAVDVTVAATPTVKGHYQTIIVVDNPLTGTWMIDIAGDDPVPAHNFAYFVNNPVPSLSLSGIPEPSLRYLRPGDRVDIEWTSNISSAHNAWLSLYYSVTNPITPSQVIEGPIVERLPLTNHGTYRWTVQGLAYIDDDYHVFARIDSNVAVAVNACGENHEYNPDPVANITGCGVMLDSSLVLPAAELSGLAEFRYEDFDPPDCPTLVGGRAAGWSSVMVQWQPNSEVDLAGYLVRCEQGALVRTARRPAVHTGGSSLLESGQVNGLIPYQTATCSVRAYDTSGNVSVGCSDSTSVVPREITRVHLPLVMKAG